MTAGDDRPKLPGDELAIDDRAEPRLGEANTVLRVALDHEVGVVLCVEDVGHRSSLEAGGRVAVEVVGSDLSNLVGDGNGLVVRVERRRLENGASEEGGSRGSDEQSLDELSSRALSGECDARRVSSKGLDLSLDVVCRRQGEGQRL